MKRNYENEKVASDLNALLDEGLISVERKNNYNGNEEITFVKMYELPFPELKTDEDVAAVKELAEIAGVNYEEYGLEMLKAGTNLSSKTEEELISADAKSFEMGGKTVRVDQVNTVDLDEVFVRETALRAAIEKQNAEEGYDLFLLMVTNILDSNTRLLVVGEPKDVVEKAFDKKLEDDKMDLPGVVSRKKQVVPPLEAAF